jgi:hypothetical protein
VRPGLNALVLTLIAALPGGGVAMAQSGFPYSIMTPEPGERPPSRPRTRPEAAPVQKQTEVQPTQPGRRRGSSSPSPLPPYESVVKPWPTPRTSIPTPQSPRVPEQPTAVPGYPTVSPPPTSLSGGSFSDKAVGCVHHGGASGIGAGQIGAYTGSCINSR